MKWYFILIIVIAVLILICFFIGFLVWKAAVPTAKPETYINKPTDDPVEIQLREFEQRCDNNLKRMPLEDCWIKSKDGLNLHAYYRESFVKTNKVIISVHGWHGDALRTSARHTYFLLDYSYNILFIDLRSYGQSEGKYTTYGVKDSQDLLQWIDYIIDRFQGDVSIALAGLSMGGNTVCCVADKVPEQVKCIIDDCGYTSANKELKDCLKRMHVPTFFFFFANIINMIVTGFSLNKTSAIRSLKGSKVPVLFLHGAKDTFVPTYMGRENFEACTSEKYYHEFENATHARSYFLNKEKYEKIVLDFLARKL
ncbi:MAG: alpha/beta fold hydrolase [Gammaproteobacteria bacterium]|nr:alpha/beta fold hydrolase [Gammaproteobacteria bacterium]